MLTRLDLIGFKSFADRTRFEFVPGVTAIVGPNGSGKSNIVDAVRWVLGEQSAKSLRGGEMADVIFNGSSTRKALGMAEVSVAFNNTRRILAIESDEVTVARRVYRDGQGEYLINDQLARLKDVKDLLLGSGASTGAYSIIEQGRVDALLTANTKDRRLIFEEAAGISRFKAKKLETLRKLDRVEADLTRVKDILAELDKHLRSLQLQAAKAQKHREYSERLKSLRIGSSAREFAALGVEWTRESSALELARTEYAEAKSRTATWETELKKVEWELSRAEDGIRHQTARLADARQQIVGSEATAKSDRNQTATIEADLIRLGRQRAEFAQRIRTLEGDLARAVAERDASAGQMEIELARVEATEAAVAAASARASEFARTAQADRDLQFELVDRHARLQSIVDSTSALLDRQRNELTRKQADAQSTAERHDALEQALAKLSQTDDDLRGRLESVRARWQELNAERDSLRANADSLQPSLDSLRDRRSVLRGRLDLLENLEQTYDGFGAGVRSVVESLAASRTPESNAIILGLVADLLTVPRDVAPMIDLALGETAQRFVVQNQEGLSLVLESMNQVPGRVGFLPLENSRDHEHAHSEPPILGAISAASLVQSEIPELGERLLGHVAVVETLADARQLAIDRPGLRIVTRSGAIVEADGTIIVGPLGSSEGLLSRKSELRELRAEFAALDERTRETETEQDHLRQRAEVLAKPIRECDAEIATLAGEAGTLREQLLRQREVQHQLSDRIELLVREADILALEVKQAEQSLSDARIRAEQADEEAKAVQARMKATDAALAAAEAERQTLQVAHTESQIALSRQKEQLSALKARADEWDVSLRQRKVESMNLAAEERAGRGRFLAGQLSTLRATAVAADSYREKEDRERQIADLTARRDLLLAEKSRLQSGVAEDRATLQAKQESLHSLELVVQSYATRREGLAVRIREDYAVELESFLLDEQEMQNENPMQEIDSLRQKIAKLGSVNLEAIDELQEVETRAVSLHAQVADLTNGRQKLVEIIEQINGDSRRLFTDTLNAVRIHFQELFRKLFGGGMADIVLDDETDVLEAGIDVIARPPGKDLRSISLLSGGEKTLTAVALLLAIFRNRPSPFCLLDEVDAALDEANTARLAGVVREFLDRSQFIVITHKKRTMASADVLYGITMQESGISKQVAVRFEDWPEEQQVEEKQPAA